MRYQSDERLTDDIHPIFRAVREENEAAVAAILRDDPEAIRARDEDEWTPLHHAAFGPVSIVKLLLAHGASPNARANCKQSPLHHASQVDVAQALLKAGAIRTLKDLSGMIPLTLAISEMNTELARLVCPEEIFFDRQYRKAYYWPKLTDDQYYPSPPVE